MLRNSLAGKDRLGNPEIDFPIGIVYGDQDFFASDGDPEEIVRASSQFKSGRSQIFKVASDHIIPREAPVELADLINSFSKGTVVGRMELKHHGEFRFRPKSTFKEQQEK